MQRSPQREEEIVEGRKRVLNRRAPWNERKNSKRIGRYARRVNLMTLDERDTKKRHCDGSETGPEMRSRGLNGSERKWLLTSIS